MEKYSKEFCFSQLYQVVPFWEKYPSYDEPDNYVELPREELEKLEQEKKNNIKEEIAPIKTVEDIVNSTISSLCIEKKNVIVILDCGHGKCTCGKKSPYSLHRILPAYSFEEWNWNRLMGRMVAAKLRERGIEVRFTVDPDDPTDTRLTTRAAIANKIQCENPGKKCLFISIHSNAAGNGTEWKNARGWCAYTTKGQNNSDILADCLYEAAENILGNSNISIRYDRSDGDKDYESNFTVIYNANMPACLIENLFYDNVEDVQILSSPSGQELIAETITQGVQKFIKKKWNM